ncbi:MAG TPA: hypothetical protein VGK01_16330 [Candidatus Angelobacter sp.]|jgi:hypothetical protein
MTVKKEDRDDYEQGRKDRDKGTFQQVFDDVTVNHPDSEAYYKGRHGDEFDEDKKNKD